MRTLFFLIATGCLAFVDAVEPGCENCGCCVNKVCNSWGKCTDGCVDGIWGDRCYNACPQQCAACAQNKVWVNGVKTHPCTKCHDGKYLSSSEDCSGICPNTCVKCSSKIVCSKCQQGYFNEGSVTDCSLSCPLNCECLNGDCVRCKAGYHDVNDYCHGVCPDGCISCSSADQCNVCKSGKYGIACEHDCSIGCYGGTCVKDSGNCNCKTGFTGTKCDQCVADKYGTDCENDCSVGCSSGTCNSNDGTCTCIQYFAGAKCDICEAGRYGTNCEHECSIGCSGGTCVRYGGTCSCKPGFDGAKCDQCVNGKYGINCEYYCSVGCSGGTCERTDGTCSCKAGFDGTMCDRCESGKYGANCEHDCSEGCLFGTCNPNGSCSCKTDFTGTTCNECVDGKYGTYCHLSCSVGCDGRTCKKDDGTCSCKTNFYGGKCDACVTGKYGTHCDQDCSFGCFGGTCTKENGACSCKEEFSGTFCKGCAIGRYGDKCDLHCSVGCSNVSCTQDDGTCECKQGFTGDMCNDCVIGKYGNQCDQNCSNTCNNSICDRSNGHCEQCVSENYVGIFCDECQVGLFGNFCNVTCPVNCDNNICTKDNGDCLSCKTNFIGLKCKICVDGRFGEDCSQECLSNNCEGGCERNSGQCQQCPTGFYGPLCKNQCSVGCSNDSCDFLTGDCSCKGGFSGDKCCVQSNHCSTCVTSTECKSCEEDYYGINCTLPCPGQCNGGCDKVSGICVNCPLGMFGDLCNITCSDTCMNITDDGIICDREDGNCSHGCLDGFHGSHCIDTCTRTCARRQCHQTSGFCALGCSEGYDGQRCDKVIEEGGSVVPVAAGVSAAVVVIVAVVVVLLVLRHRRLKGNETHEAKSPDFGSVTTETHFGTVTPLEEGDSNGKQVDHVYGNAPEAKLSINQLYQKITSELGECKAEFKRLKQGMQQPHTDAKRHENQSKNRYRGLYPYDHSRVRIQSIPDFFINASYINGYQKDNAYIASLGPTKDTTKDFETFWVMLWHHQSDIIVMLTNLQEPSGMKCHQYWPIVEASLTFGDLMVVGCSEEEHAEYTERIFTVSKGGQNRTVRQFHYTAWPDKSIPESITSLVEFHQHVEQVQQMSAGPIIVHCSAGIGRTGTYIALDRLTQEGRTEGAVNVFECVHGMREQRVNMVQTCDQYIYLYKTVVHSLMFDSEAISSDEFPSAVTSLNESSLQQQIRKLRQTFDVDSAEEQNAREANAKHTSANRDGADIPGDYRRPRLYLDRKFSDSDYINAIYVDSFQRRNQFLVAQTPLPETLSDFVTLLYQENCECIVSMEDMMSNSSTIGTYLPPVNQDLEIGNFKITSSKCQTSQQYQVRKLTLTKIGQTNTTKEMYHFQYTKWNKKHNVPEDPSDFIQFIKEVEKYDSDSKTDVRPIMVHCLTGAAKSGLFTIVWNLLEKMEAENQVSVLNTVRQVRLRRKKIIQNVEQLRFCYQCVNQYLNMFSTYSNFAVEPTPHRI